MQLCCLMASIPNESKTHVTKIYGPNMSENMGCSYFGECITSFKSLQGPNNFMISDEDKGVNDINSANIII